MKAWNNPVVEELNIKETAQHLLGLFNDGGFVGDGHAGQHGCKCTEKNPCLLHKGCGGNDNNNNNDDVIGDPNARS